MTRATKKPPARKKPALSKEPEPEPEPSVCLPSLPEPEPERRMKTISVVYKGKTYNIPPFFQPPNSRGECRTLINDTTVELFLCHWMVNERFDDAARAKCSVFNSFFHHSLQLRIQNHLKEPPRRPELGSIFRQIFRRMDTGLLNKEMIVLPIHIEKPKHWLLAIIHNARGAIRRIVPVDNDPNNNNNSASIWTCRIRNYDFEETPECRILIMDSLYNWPKYKEVLKTHHNQLLETLRLWLQMTAAAAGEELLASRVKAVVCEKLPRQSNSVDCGIYMMTFAEYFTWFNTEWTTIPTDNLAYLKMDPEMEKELRTDLPRQRLEALLKTINEQP